MRRDAAAGHGEPPLLPRPPPTSPAWLPLPSPLGACAPVLRRHAASPSPPLECVCSAACPPPTENIAPEACFVRRGVAGGTRGVRHDGEHAHALRHPARPHVVPRHQPAPPRSGTCTEGDRRRQRWEGWRARGAVEGAQLAQELWHVLLCAAAEGRVVVVPPARRCTGLTVPRLAGGAPQTPAALGPHASTTSANVNQLSLPWPAATVSSCLHASLAHTAALPRPC